MTVNERFKCVIEGKQADRLPAIEWAPWWYLTTDRWRTEGLPASAQSVFDIQDYFGLDKCIQLGFGWRGPTTPVEK